MCCCFLFVLMQKHSFMRFYLLFYFLPYLSSNLFIHIDIIFWCNFKRCKKCIRNSISEIMSVSTAINPNSKNIIFTPRNCAISCKLLMLQSPTRNRFVIGIKSFQSGILPPDSKLKHNCEDRYFCVAGRIGVNDAKVTVRQRYIFCAKKLNNSGSSYKAAASCTNSPYPIKVI